MSDSPGRVADSRLRGVSRPRNKVAGCESDRTSSAISRHRSRCVFESVGLGFCIFPRAIATLATRLMPMVRLVSMQPEDPPQQKHRVSAPSRVAPSVLLRAVSAADWIAADLRDDGDLESARLYERIAADLRAHAHARGIHC